MRIVNLTPHALTFVAGDEIVASIPSSGQARCAQSRQQIGTVDLAGHAIPVNRTQFGAVSGLPEPEPGTIYVVSVVVASALAGSRDDVYVTDDAVRDADGRVIGCRALARL